MSQNTVLSFRFFHLHRLSSVASFVANTFNEGLRCLSSTLDVLHDPLYDPNSPDFQDTWRKGRAGWDASLKEVDLEGPWGADGFLIRDENESAARGSAREAPRVVRSTCLVYCTCAKGPA